MYSVTDLGAYKQTEPKEPSVPQMLGFNTEFEEFMKTVYSTEYEWKMKDMETLNPHESQVLWYAVTQSVRRDQSNKASEWKSYIEERQRKLRQSYESEEYPMRYYIKTMDWLPFKFRIPKIE